MSSDRRRGSEDSPTRDLLLDATEKLMIEEGYGAVTSRKVAARAGLKHQIVHYYFRTMDDLFLAVQQRLGELFMAQLDEIATSDEPITALWEMASHRHSAALEMEFLALANHRKSIRSGIARQQEQFRTKATQSLVRNLPEKGFAPPITPAAIAVLIASAGRYMTLEELLGVTKGHAETRALVEYLIDIMQN